MNDAMKKSLWLRDSSSNIQFWFKGSVIIRYGTKYFLLFLPLTFACDFYMESKSFEKVGFHHSLFKLNVKRQCHKKSEKFHIYTFIILLDPPMLTLKKSKSQSYFILLTSESNHFPEFLNRCKTQHEITCFVITHSIFRSQVCFKRGMCNSVL